MRNTITSAMFISTPRVSYLPTDSNRPEHRLKKGGKYMEIEAYIMGLRVIAPRNKSGIIRLVADMMKEHPKIDVEKDVIEKLYPEDRERRRRR